MVFVHFTNSTIMASKSDAVNFFLVNTRFSFSGGSQGVFGKIFLQSHSGSQEAKSIVWLMKNSWEGASFKVQYIGIWLFGYHFKAFVIIRECKYMNSVMLVLKIEITMVAKWIENLKKRQILKNIFCKFKIFQLSKLIFSRGFHITCWVKGCYNGSPISV